MQSQISRLEVELNSSFLDASRVIETVFIRGLFMVLYRFFMFFHNFCGFLEVLILKHTFMDIQVVVTNVKKVLTEQEHHLQVEH